MLWRALLLESAILLGARLLVGALFGLYGQLLLSRALSLVTGFPVIESSPVPAGARHFALVTAVAVAMVALPGYSLLACVPAGMPELRNKARPTAHPTTIRRIPMPG